VCDDDIGLIPTQSWRVEIHQDGGWRLSVTRAAVCMEEGKGCEQDTGVHTISLQVGNENRYAYKHCRAIKDTLAPNK